MAKNTGWTKAGRPFSKKEYDNSYIKDSFKMTYAGYLKELARQEGTKKKPAKKTTKKTNYSKFATKNKLFDY